MKEKKQKIVKEFWCSKCHKKVEIVTETVGQKPVCKCCHCGNGDMKQILNG